MYQRNCKKNGVNAALTSHSYLVLIKTQITHYASFVTLPIFVMVLPFIIFTMAVLS